MVSLNDFFSEIFGGLGCSVTQRIKQIQQPQGGYINPNDLTVTFRGYSRLNRFENVSPALVGLCVDYLTRFITGTPPEDAFQISLLGAEIIRESDIAFELLHNVTSLDDLSIKSAVQLANYDTCYRAGVEFYDPLDDSKLPNTYTAENIRIMVTRSIDFLEAYGPKILDGFTFENGYTNTISTGDGDFLTNDTLWDFKVSKYPPKQEHTLQLLVYWRMGLHSIHPEFKNISYLGLFNPRLNTVYRIPVIDIPSSIIDVVEKEVIGY